MHRSFHIHFVGDMYFHIFSFGKFKGRTRNLTVYSHRLHIFSREVYDFFVYDQIILVNRKVVDISFYRLFKLLVRTTRMKTKELI